MRCPRVEQCGLPGVLKSDVALLLWRRACCDDDRRYQQCQRFRIAESGRAIPTGMLPNGYTLGPAWP